MTFTTKVDGFISCKEMVRNLYWNKQNKTRIFRSFCLINSHSFPRLNSSSHVYINLISIDFNHALKRIDNNVCERAGHSKVSLNISEFLTLKKHAKFQQIIFRKSPDDESLERKKLFWNLFSFHKFKLHEFVEILPPWSMNDRHWKALS